MKLLKCIRFDGSDERIFDIAAAPDEWAVPGGFAFTQLSRDDISGKTRQAFANGFLGLQSFGHSTFVTVKEAGPGEEERLARHLANHFVDRYGAPDMNAALPVAKEEISFTAGLCRHVAINTVFTLRRYFDDDGEIREEFRTIEAPAGPPAHARIWSVVDDDA